MGLEILFALIMCATIYAGIAVFRRFSSEHLGDPAFERWCASEPMILAVRCRDAHEVRMALRQFIAPSEEIENRHGGAPWQYYQYDVVARVTGETVVTLHLRAASLRLGEGKKGLRDAADLVEHLRARAELGIEEVWLHGQLHPSDAPSQRRDRTHWLASGSSPFAPMIGTPRWTLAADEQRAA